MKALVFHEPNDIRLTDVDVPPLRTGEMRIRIQYSGICGTDLRIYRGVKAVSGPRIIGHEFFGAVSETAGEVGGFAIGDRVVVYPIIACGDCYACREGRKNICVNRKTIGYEIDGGFAEFVTIPAAAIRAGNVLHVPDGVSDVAATASEPAAAALQGVRRAGEVAGKTVVVMGGGPLGILHVQYSRLFGARKVILSEPDPTRRQQAARFGVDVAVHPSELTDAAAGEAEVAFIDAGVPTLVNDAVGLLRKGGRCVIFAGMPENSLIQIDPNRLHYAEIDIVGSSGSTPGLQSQVLGYVNDGRLTLEGLVSDVLPMADWKQGFAMKADATGLKVLINFGA